MTGAQRDIWVLCQLSDEGSAAYNLATALEMSGDLDVEALHEALRRHGQRHESLRTTIDLDGDHMVVHGTGDVPLRVIDIAG